MARGERGWTREDSLIVLAGYCDRPPRALLPPSAERERIANLLRVDVSAVTRRLWMFAGLDPDNKAEGEPAGSRERRLWKQYADDRVSLMMDADDAIRSKGRIPRALQEDD